MGIYISKYFIVYMESDGQKFTIKYQRYWQTNNKSQLISITLDHTIKQLALTDSRPNIKSNVIIIRTLCGRATSAHRYKVGIKG